MLITSSLPSKDTALLVAVSGGRDSMALLHLLLQEGWKNLIICHINHGLRGEHSDQDSEFVKKHAQDLSIPCEILNADVVAFAKKENLSIELAARNIRYDFFHTCSLVHSTAHLLLAHHADDQAETLIHNLFRGSQGLKGMQVISQRNELILHRPLLNTRRSEIDSFISSQQIPYREDLTNSQPIATRNRLRNELIPLLEDILNRDPIPPLLKIAQEQISLTATLDEFLDPQGRIFLPKLRDLPSFFQSQIIHLYLKKERVPNISTDLIQRCLSLIDPQSPAKINLPGELYFRRKEARLFIQ